jgi:hypothetical protein
MNRTTMILAALALIAVAVATPFQLFNVPLAPVVALVFGAIAGWWLAATRGEHTAQSGVQAGGIVGLAALLGSIIGLAVLALWVGNIPEVQTFVQNSEPHPEARIPTEWIAPLGALAGVVVGFFAGLFDLALSALAGWAAGALYGYNHPAKA